MEGADMTKSSRDHSRIRVHHHSLDSRRHRDAATAIGSRVTVVDSGCWIADAHVDWKHYRSVRVSGQAQQAHRVTYSIVTHEHIDGLHVHHKCQVPACVNPEHLQALTSAEHGAAHAELHRLGETAPPSQHMQYQ